MKASTPYVDKLQLRISENNLKSNNPIINKFKNILKEDVAETSSVFKVKFIN